MTAQAGTDLVFSFDMQDVVHQSKTRYWSCWPPLLLMMQGAENNLIRYLEVGLDE